MKRLNITKERFEKSKYFKDKYGKLEYVSESGKMYKTDKGQVLKFKESGRKFVKEAKSSRDWLDKLDRLGYDVETKGEGQYRTIIIKLKPDVAARIEDLIHKLGVNCHDYDRLYPSNWDYTIGGYMGEPKKGMREFLQPKSGWPCSDTNGYARQFNIKYEEDGFHMTNDFQIIDAVNESSKPRFVKESTGEIVEVSAVVKGRGRTIEEAINNFDTELTSLGSDHWGDWLYNYDPETDQYKGKDKDRDYWIAEYNKWQEENGGDVDITVIDDMGNADGVDGLVTISNTDEY